MSATVVVTGRGLICPLGDDPGRVHAALCEGKSGLGPVDLFDTQSLSRPIAGQLRGFDAKAYLGNKNVRPLDRTSRLVTSAAQLALSDSGWTPEMRAAQEVGLVLSTVYGSVRTIAEFDRRAIEAGPSYASPMDFANTVINAAAGQAAIWHGLRGINSTVSSGQAAGLQAIAYAAGLIASGRSNALLAGGAEELCLESFLSMERAGLVSRTESDPVPFAAGGGILPGEGAALLVLESASLATGRGARVLAEIRGAGAAFDPSIGADTEQAVRASELAVRRALQEAGLEPDAIGGLLLSANGGSLDVIQTRALAKVFGGRAASVPITAIKASLGETMGADGGLQAVAALETLRTGTLPGIRGFRSPGPDFPFPQAGAEPRPLAGEVLLLVSLGWDGHHSALLLSRPTPVDARARRDPEGPALELVPRLSKQGYSRDEVGRRRAWVERKTGIALRHVGATSIEAADLRGNIENPIGSAQMPLGIAGPLLINGQHARGVFYVPLATTEGALVRSYERGMMVLSRAGGVTTRVEDDQNRVSPVFVFQGLEQAHDFARELPGRFEALRAEAESTTSHGRLLRTTPHVVGRDVIVEFSFFTGDAHGMNMIAKATHRACEWLLQHTAAERYYLFSGLESEKKASGNLLPGGKGKRVVAGARITPSLMRTHLHVEPSQLADLWRRTVVGTVHAQTVGYNGHFANGLTAMFIALGQDVANVVNAATGITNLELLADGALYASVTLPSLTVATVGGGTRLGTSRECLEILDCFGAGRAAKLSEIVAASLLAGELSIGAAIASDEFVAAHEQYGRNRPPQNPLP